MAQLYVSEDIEAIYGYMDEYMKGDIVMMEKFLDERNNNWIPEIAKFSKEASTFYGVGAAHLGGDQGVVNLLRKAGYTSPDLTVPIAIATVRSFYFSPSHSA